MGPISRLSPYHNPGMKELLLVKLDPQAAREILNELGAKDGDENGVRELPSGSPGKVFDPR